MTTTVRELKIWLEQFDEDTIVEVLEKECRDFGDTVVSRDLKTGEFGNWDFYDFNKNERVNETHPYFGKKVLTLGED